MPVDVEYKRKYSQAVAIVDSDRVRETMDLQTRRVPPARGLPTDICCKLVIPASQETAHVRSY